MKPAGWYLGLRYMQGSGLIARVAEAIEHAHRGVDFIFADRVLLNEYSFSETGSVPPPLRGRLGGGCIKSFCTPPLTPPARGGEHHGSYWREILVDWWDALSVGGYLILWLPDCRYQNLAQHEDRVTLHDIEHALDDVAGWQLHEADIIDGFIFAVWQKRGDTKQWRTPWRKQPKHILVARTGAHGDALMASSILPWLKEQGWAISFISRRAGIETLKHDPHIDELIWLAEGQAPDEDMPYYWQAWEKRFDRFINLTHSVEGELLKQPGRADYYWPDEQRRKLCKRSYLQHTHQIADVPGPYRVCFYPDAGEKAWAACKAAGYGKFVLWCLRGSAEHKWWPYGPQAICRLLAHTDWNIVLTGDGEAAALAEDILRAVRNYYGDSKRVHNLVAAHSLREMMTLAHHAAVVVGPETGILNAVSLQPVPKVLMLSHSAPENLSNDWINVTALKPTSPCYPCHRLHYGHEWCPQDEATQAAACSASIDVDQVVEAVTASARSKPTQPYWQRGERVISVA